MNTGNLGYMDMIPLGQPYIGLVFSAVFVIFLEGLEWYLVRGEYGSWVNTEIFFESNTG